MDLDIYEQYFQITDPASLAKQFKGNSSSELLVIVPAASSHLSLIAKILQAINIEQMDDILTLELNENDQISLIPAIKNYAVNRIISFGIPCHQLGIHIDYQLYQTAHFQGKAIITTADLTTVSQNADHKKALWSSLKQWAS